MGSFNRLKKEMKRSERQDKGCIDGGGQGAKVSCRVFALEEAGFQRESEQQRRKYLQRERAAEERKKEQEKRRWAGGGPKRWR